MDTVQPRLTGHEKYIHEHDLIQYVLLMSIAVIKRDDARVYPT